MGNSESPRNKTPDFQNGDVLATYGSGGIWPLRRLALWVVYREIRAYQKAKWGEGCDYHPTHVRVWLNGRFFEMTTPVGKWTPLSEVLLEKKKWKVARYKQGLQNVEAMEAKASNMVGKKYDVGDLLDFGFSGLLGVFAKRFRLFGDRGEKYTVCSTALAKVLKAGGAQLSISRKDLRPSAEIAEAFKNPSIDTIVLEDNTIDPAYFVNNPSHWEVIESRL